jgi:uncharacterized membrane protein YidH (DUF202 family)
MPCECKDAEVNRRILLQTRRLLLAVKRLVIGLLVWAAILTLEVADFKFFDIDVGRDGEHVPYLLQNANSFLGLIALGISVLGSWHAMTKAEKPQAVDDITQW